MTAIEDAGVGHGSIGSPQGFMEESIYPAKEAINEIKVSQSAPPHYNPSPKHELGHNWGSENPIKSSSEGQYLLDTGYQSGRQVYNVTENGKIVKFQPDGTPENGFHAYEVSSPRDIPSAVLKQMLNDGKITRAEYNRLRKGKR